MSKEKTKFKPNTPKKENSNNLIRKLTKNIGVNKKLADKMNLKVLRSWETMMNYRFENRKYFDVF
jgi:hypothetical protein